jgi:hypothetical protein
MQDWHPALEAHREVFAQRQKDSRMAEGWLWSRYESYGQSATTPSALAFHHEIEDLLAADTVTLSHEMMDLTQHALESFNGQEPWYPDDIEIEAGFLYLPEPFYVHDRHHKKVCWRAMLWRLVPDVLTKNLETGEEQYEWGVRFILYSHIDDPDDYPLPAELREQADRTGWRWGYAHATTLPLSMAHKSEHLSNEGDPSFLWLLFTRVVQKLMQETIVVSEPQKPPRPQRRDIRRAFREDTDRLVTVIQLRRPRERKQAEGESRNVNWMGRWIVRGFWRNQWYPSKGRHQQKWIAAYEKGPKDLPLIIRERVWVWDR